MELIFHGAAQEVTGSCYLLHAGRHRILIECGLIQGSPADEARNRQPFPFDARHIDAVILTHAHLDHSGRLPLLVRAGFSGPIYTHAATADLARIMLKDAAYLNEKDAEWENRKRERKRLPFVEPLYTRSDAERALGQFQGLKYGEVTEIVPGVSLRLRDAGHILGSAIAEIWVGEGTDTRKLVASGDLGHRGAPILRDPEFVGEADLVLLEGTYGDRNHRSWESTLEELSDIFAAARHSHGNILIPSFAVGRTQELLYLFGRHRREWRLDDWTIFLDSPMAIEATEIYARHAGVYDQEAAAIHRERGNPFRLPNLHYSRTADDSMAINQIRAGAIIIAGSGMCDGGRIKHHLKHNVWREHCHVVIVGYQSRGTLGRALVDGAKRVRLWGEAISVAAQIHTVGGLSAHADADGLAGWYGGFAHRPPVALIHGEPPALESLAQRLTSLGASRVWTPRAGERIDLAALL